MKKLLNFLLLKLFWGFFRHFLSDKWYAKIRYRLELHRWPNINNPQLFTEKIQYIKLYERTDIRREKADRRAVRSYVSKKTGPEYLIPLIGDYEDLTQQAWQSLPRQFVLKANHGCGMLCIVFDKNKKDYIDVYQQTEQWKKIDYFTIGREWVYKNLPRTIVAEELLLNSDKHIPRDYKFFCFNGKVRLIQIDYDRFGEQKRNLYDQNFKRIEGTLLHPNYEDATQKPAKLAEAIEVAETLAADLSFIRVDLYIMDDDIYFGEMTNYPGNGFIPFQPNELEHRMGSLINLRV